MSNFFKNIYILERKRKGNKFYNKNRIEFFEKTKFKI